MAKHFFRFSTSPHADRRAPQSGWLGSPVELVGPVGNITLLYANVFSSKALNLLRFRQFEFSMRVCSLFTDFVENQGLSVNQAVMRTYRVLRGENHPLATYDCILDVLINRKRFRRKYGMKMKR